MTNTDSGIESTALRLLEHCEQTQILGRIEGMLWLVAALLLAIAVLLYLGLRKLPGAHARDEGDWLRKVEDAYGKAEYDRALDILETASLLNPGSGLVTYWQGRCYFQSQDWEKAAATFEALLRQEPIFRKSIKDYMAFIELNELVPGVEGYLDQGD